MRYQADALTLSPFMGFDSIEPYMRYEGKGLILLCRTSNPGGSDLQFETLASGDRLFEQVAKLAAGRWNRDQRLGLVVGATFPSELARVRELGFDFAQGYFIGRPQPLSSCADVSASASGA